MHLLKTPKMFIRYQIKQKQSVSLIGYKDCPIKQLLSKKFYRKD